MAFYQLCARRCAILAALAGGLLIAVAVTTWSAAALVWSGHTGLAAIRSGLGLFGW